MSICRHVCRQAGMYVGIQECMQVDMHMCLCMCVGREGIPWGGGWPGDWNIYINIMYIYIYIYYDYRNMLHDRQHMVYMVQDRGAKLLGEFLSVFSLGLRIGQENMFAACAKKLQLVTLVGFLQGWFGAYSRLVQNIVMVGLGVVERLGLLWDSCRCKGYARLGFGFMKAGYGFI